MVELFDQLREPRVDWREQLRRFVSATSKQDYSWSPPNRRHMAANLYLPSVKSEGIGDVVFAIDTSASMDSDALQCALDELNAILHDAEPERVHVLECDTQIHRAQAFGPGDYPITIDAHGRGGTRFRPVFDWVEEQDLRPACLLARPRRRNPEPNFRDPILGSRPMTPQEFKRWRAEMGWSQQVASDHLGVNLRTVKYYEQGVTSGGAVLVHVPTSIAIAALALRFIQDVAQIGAVPEEKD